MPSDPSVWSSSKDSWCPDPKHCVCLHFLERNCGQLNTYVGIQVEQTQAASWLSPWDGGRGQIPWDSPDPPGKEKSYWNLLSTEPQEQIILKPWGGCVMQCPNLTGFLSFPSLWNLCRRKKKKKKKACFFFPLSLICSCVWWLGLVASSGKPGICSPLCFFCEENYNMKRKGGGEEHYILNSLREIIAKSVKLSHFSPCPPPRLLWISSAPRIWWRTHCRNCCCRWTRELWPVLPRDVPTSCFLLIFLEQPGTTPCYPQGKL